MDDELTRHFVLVVGGIDEVALFAQVSGNLYVEEERMRMSLFLDFIKLQYYIVSLVDSQNIQKGSKTSARSSRCDVMRIPRFFYLV